MSSQIAIDGSYTSARKFCEDVTSAVLHNLSAKTGISRLQFFHEAHLGGWEKPEPPFRKRGDDSDRLPNDFQATIEVEEMNGHPYNMHGWVAHVSATKSGPASDDPIETVEGQIFFCPKE